MHHFRDLRRRLFDGGRMRTYFAYAAGELLLIVAGILIAMQIGNWNTARQDRARELTYLTNIRADLVANVALMDRFLVERNDRIAAARRILTHFAGKPIEDVSAFNADGLNIYSWERFYLGNNTYQELVSSGNFALLSNHGIKKQLLDIEALYSKMKSEEDHYRFDSETALYRPIYELLDTEEMTADFAYRASGGREGRTGVLTAGSFRPLLNSLTLKNGFVMTVLEYGTMNAQMAEMRTRCRDLIAAIDAELRRG
jgi:uncharacterized protein DUF6090